MTYGVIPASSAGSVANVRSSPPAPAHHRAFHELLSELNPLQYIPVVGTIYRAVTGDTIPETARTVGSLVVSGLTGGPLGVATSLAAVAIEKATGFEPERFGRRVLNFLGIGSALGPSPIPGSRVLLAAASTTPAHALPSPAAWSVGELKSLGVSTAADGSLLRGEASGCDVLNNLELARLNTPSSFPGTSLASGFQPIVA